MMIGSNAAVSRSPLAQAATSASATSRSVMPCRLGRRRLCQAAANTGAATSAAAAPATRSDRVRSSFRRNAIATSSRQPAAKARLSRRPSVSRSLHTSSGRLGRVAAASRVEALMASPPAGSGGCRPTRPRR